MSDELQLKQLQEDFWENMGDVFGYDIIGSQSHPLKKAFELYCEMIKEQKEDSEEEEEEEEKPENDNCCKCGRLWDKGRVCDCGCSHRACCDTCKEEDDEEFNEDCEECGAKMSLTKLTEE